MMVTAALIRDTMREALARKVFWGLFGISTALILFFLLLLKIDVVQGAIATISLFGTTSHWTRDVGLLVRRVHAGIASFLYTALMFLAVFASAGLIPSMFEPGRIELLLSKPVSRAHLLAGRYAGNMLVVALNVCYLVLGVWVIFGWKTGVWQPTFLYAIAATIFMFAVLLSAIVLVAVLSESAALATMITFALMILSPILAQRHTAERLLASEWSRELWRWLYWVFPKVYDVGRINLWLVGGNPVQDWTPVWSSAIFAAAALTCSLLALARRDF